MHIHMVGEHKNNTPLETHRFVIVAAYMSSGRVALSIPCLFIILCQFSECGINASMSICLMNVKKRP